MNSFPYVTHWSKKTGVQILALGHLLEHEPCVGANGAKFKLPACSAVAPGEGRGLLRMSPRHAMSSLVQVGRRGRQGLALTAGNLPKA